MKFDTLALSRKLKASGFTPEQAEALADALGSTAVETCATKADLSALAAELKADLTRLFADATVAKTAVVAVLVLAPGRPATEGPSPAWPMATQV